MLCAVDEVTEAFCPHAVPVSRPARDALERAERLEPDELPEPGVIAVPDAQPVRSVTAAPDVLLVPDVQLEPDELPEPDATVPVADGFGWAADASRLVEDGSPEFEDGLPAPARCAAAALFLGGSVAGSAPDVAAGRQDVPL